MMRQIVLYPGEDGYWVVECPSLPGCVSQGEDKSKAVSNIREAIEGYIAALQEDGLPVPEERSWLYDKRAPGFRAPVRRRTVEKGI
jgi:predicted RNase H-like HicB family nuclease